MKTQPVTFAYFWCNTMKICEGFIIARFYFSLQILITKHWVTIEFLFSLFFWLAPYFTPCFINNFWSLLKKYMVWGSSKFLIFLIIFESKTHNGVTVYLEPFCGKRTHYILLSYQYLHFPCRLDFWKNENCLCQFRHHQILIILFASNIHTRRKTIFLSGICHVLESCITHHWHFVVSHTHFI